MPPLQLKALVQHPQLKGEVATRNCYPWEGISSCNKKFTLVEGNIFVQMSCDKTCFLVTIHLYFTKNILSH